MDVRRPNRLWPRAGPDPTSTRALPTPRDCVRVPIRCPVSTYLPYMPDPYYWLASL
jgi:hypothetical protein